MDNIPPAETPISRIRYLMQIQHLSQADLCRRLGAEKAYISRVLAGKIPLTDRLINKIVIDLGVSKEWLTTGNDLPFAKPVHATHITSPMPEAPRGIAVYDIDVTAGAAELTRSLTSDRIMGYVDMPQIGPECVIVRVSGDSMSPAITNGSFIAIRPVPSSGIIFWGQIYVVITENYRMVKFLRRHDNPAYVTLHSDNPAYDDIEMPRSDIESLYLVETVINYDRRC